MRRTAWEKACSLSFVSVGVLFFIVVVIVEARNVEDVLRVYNKNIPPPHEDVDLHMGVRYSNLLDIKNKDQIMSSRFRVSLEYTDSRLAWGESIKSPETYVVNKTKTDRTPHLNAVIVPGEMVWAPVLMMMNSVQIMQTAPEVALVESNGRVALRKYWKAETTCNLNLGSFPYDVQHCSLIFDVVSFGVFIQHKPKSLTMVTSENSVGDLQYFVQNSEWEIKKQTARIVKDESNFAAVIDIVVSRRGLYYIQFLLAPGVVITLIAFFGFLLPPEGGHYKATLGVTCLLSMAVFRLVLQDHLNPDEEAVNVLGLYLDSLSLNIALIVMSSIFVVYLHNMGNKPLAHEAGCWTLAMASAIAKLTCRPEKCSALDAALRLRRRRGRRRRGGTEPTSNGQTAAGVTGNNAKMRYPSCNDCNSAPRRPSVNRQHNLAEAPASLTEYATLLVSIRQRVDRMGNIVPEQAGVRVVSREAVRGALSASDEREAEAAQAQLTLEWKLVAQQINVLLFAMNFFCFVAFTAKIWMELHFAMKA